MSEQQKQQDPVIDLGFHIVIPRIVRNDQKFKDLTPSQKWLYVCIKDLCGDHGTCYRTLRCLSEETGMSTGALSEFIPILHKAELIHAEKKKRTTGGKEVWHITVTDIWQANAKVNPTKRSHAEQNNQCSQNERSHAEQECSQNRDRSNTKLSNTKRECVVSPTIPATEDPHPPLSANDTQANEQLSTPSPVNVDKSDPIASEVEQMPTRKVVTANTCASTAPPIGPTPINPIPDLRGTSPAVKPSRPAPKELYSQGARDIRKLYDSVHGIKTGHPTWDWEAMEDMTASGVAPTEEDMRLVYTYVKDTLKKIPSIKLVWENWKELNTLKVAQPEQPELVEVKIGDTVVKVAKRPETELQRQYRLMVESCQKKEVAQ